MSDDVKAEVSETVKQLRAPYYWMSGSEEYHEGENDLPFKSADLLEALAARLAEVEVQRNTRHREMLNADAFAEKQRVRAEAAEARLAEVEVERDGARKANREMLLEVLAASGQAQEAYEAQLAAEAEVVRLRTAAGAAEAAGIERAAVWLESVPQVLPDRQELASAIRKLKHTKDHPST